LKYKGIIKDFEKIVVSDPHYLQDVWCRYDKTFNQKEDWKVEFIIKEVDEMQEYKGHEFKVEGLDFCIIIRKENITCDLLDIGRYVYKKGTEIKKTEIGIDTAQVCMGVNEKAKEINDYATKMNKDDTFENLFTNYNPPFAIQTMSDGMLGSVQEGIDNGDTSFICITGFFDECADVKTIDELKDYIVEQLNIENLELKKEYSKNNDINYDI